MPGKSRHRSLKIICLMKKILVFLLGLLFLSQFVIGQNTSYFTIYPAECTNCLSQLAYVRQLDKNMQRVIVFAKKYRGDSVAVIKRMELEDIQNNVVWSDSLYNLYKGNNLVVSTASLYNAESGNIIKTSLARLENNLHYFSSINRTDTLPLSQRAFGAETTLKNSGQYIYCFDELSHEVRTFDKVDGQYLYTLALTDSLIKEGFKLHFSKNTWEKEYVKSKEFCSRRKIIDAQAYKAFACSNDTVYLLANHSYVIVMPAGDVMDTLAIPFLTLSTYKNGVLAAFSLVENYIGLEWKGMQRGIHRTTKDNKPVPEEGAYYVPSGEIVVHSNQLYLSLIGGFADGIPNHFLARYKKDETKNEYEFASLFSRSLPPEYNNIGYNFVEPISSHGPYISLYLSDHLFSLNPTFPDIELNILARMPSGLKGIYDLKVNKDNIYLIYSNGVDKYMRYIKYSTQKMKVTVDTPLTNYKDGTSVSNPSIDDFDPNFVYIPLSDKIIERRKVGK